MELGDKNMSKLRRTSITVYFVLAYTISWVGSFLAVGTKFLETDYSQMIDIFKEKDFQLVGAIMVLTPFLLGITMTGITDGKNDVKTLFSRMGIWKIGFRWYLALLIFPLSILMTLLFLSISVSTEFRPTLFSAGIFMGLAAGFFEETGWTGFAFPKMINKYSALKASLILGVLHVVWHFGANYLGASNFRGTYFLPQFIAFCISMVAMRIILCWVYVNTESLLIGQLIHASSSGFLGIFVPLSIPPAFDTLFYIVYSVALWVPALIIIIKYGKDMKLAPSEFEKRTMNLKKI